MKRKRIFFDFSWLFLRLFDILQIFWHILNRNVKGFQKMYIKSYFGKKSLKTFLLYKPSSQKVRRVFANVLIFLQILYFPYRDFTTPAEIGLTLQQNETTFKKNLFYNLSEYDVTLEHLILNMGLLNWNSVQITRTLQYARLFSRSYVTKCTNRNGGLLEENSAGSEGN